MQPGDHFVRCLLEQKNEETRNARRLRRRTLLIAVLIQVVILSLLMLRPLFGAQEPAMLVHWVPLPPWKGGGATPASETHHPSSGRRDHAHTIRDILQPTFVPLHAAEHEDDDASAPDIGPVVGNDDGPGEGSDPNGLIPGGGPPGFHPVPPPPQPEPPPPPRGPRHVDPNIQQAMLVTRVEPQYPGIAKQAHIEGVVQLRAVIAKDGSVQSLEVLSGNILLAKAARDAIVQWRYRPTLLRGEPVEVETLITVIFKMPR